MTEGGGALDEGQHYTVAGLPLEISTHCAECWVGLEASLDSIENHAPTKIRSLDSPAHRALLYLLHYPRYALNILVIKDNLHNT
jgi:hypothetical protein